MPGVVLTKGDQERYFFEDELGDAQADGWAPRAGQKVSVRESTGPAATVEADELEGFRRQGASLVPGEEVSREYWQQAKEQAHGGLAGGAAALGAGIARGVTLGGSDVALRALGVEAEQLRDLEDVHTGLSLGGEAVGAILPAVLSGGSTAGASGARASASLGRRLLAASPTAILDRGAVALGRAAGGGLRGAAVRGVAEGAIGGLGAGVSELAMSDDPLDAERAVSVLSSGALYGGSLGGGLSVFTSAAGKGLARARKLAEDAASSLQARTGAGLADDLTALDRKGLRAARDVEVERLRAENLTDRSTVADEVIDYHKASKEAYPWLATKGTDDRALKGIWKANERAQRRLRSLGDNVKELARNPSKSLSALEIQEQALESLVARQDDIMAKLAAEGREEGARAAALRRAPELLEQNRALQGRIQDVSEAFRTPKSQRLDEIADAMDTVGERGRKGFLQRSAEGALTGLGTQALAPVAGFTGGAMIASKLSESLSDLVFGRLSKAGAEASERMSRAIGQFVDVGARVGKSAPPVAAKVLTRVQFAEQREDDGRTARPNKTVAAFKAREKELRGQVEARPGGGVKMRDGARRALGDRLSGVRLLSPVAADRMETTAARRIEFLASKLPKRPDIFAAGQLVSPEDHWRPSDFEIAEFARYVTAVEDPAGVVERLVDGSVTPEDAEALREVYPEIYAEVQAKILSELPRLRKQLPFARRLALSILTDVPVDPAMDPRILRVLQASYANEQGTEGGIQPPTPQPQFGSLSRPEPTPAQERIG